MTFSLEGSWLEAVWLTESRLIYEEELDLHNRKFSPKQLLSLEDEDCNFELEFIFCGKAQQKQM